jgi:hypothetical protein
MSDFLSGLFGSLFGQPEPVDWNAKALADQQWAAHQESSLWRPYWDPYGGRIGDGPRDHAWIWINRVGWEKPDKVEPSRMDPQMNVMGLYWMPAPELDG